jgi:hypothetical protein
MNISTGKFGRAVFTFAVFFQSGCNLYMYDKGKSDIPTETA